MKAVFRQTPGYRTFVLGMLWLVMALSFLDRQIMAVVLEPVKAEFGFSDTQLGLLGGVAFAVFYVAFGFPIAWALDRGNRVRILSAAVFAWSLMTALCGLVTGFFSLFLARAGVAIGEAGGNPASQSLMADYFPPERRGAAFAVLGTSIPVAVMSGYIIGGWLVGSFGWRHTFLFLGIPGVLVALACLLLVAEPPRGASEQRSAGDAIPMSVSVRRLLSRPAYRWLMLAGAFAGMGAWGTGLWLPSFFIRIHDMPIARAGAMIGLIFGIGGTIGTLAGGALADRLVSRMAGGRRWYMWLPTVTLALGVPLAAAAYQASTAGMALALLAAAVTLTHFYMGPTMALVQALAGLRSRATSSAVYSFVSSLISMGLGPLIVGVASDIFGVEQGPEALRYAMIFIVILSYGGAALFFWLGSRSLEAGMDVALKDE